jgi:hypothetical protein
MLGIYYPKEKSTFFFIFTSDQNHIYVTYVLTKFCNEMTYKKEKEIQYGFSSGVMTTIFANMPVEQLKISIVHLVFYYHIY